MFAGAVNQTIAGAANADDLFGAGGADTLNGGGGGDRLFGEDGNDTLNGGAGVDRLEGGIGNDMYDIGETGDQAIEALGAGIDTVRTALASHTLAANIEKLQFTDTGNHTGRGNGLNNTLNGNSGDDKFLADAAGNDVFSGGAGSDSMDFRAGASGAVIDFSTLAHGGAAEEPCGQAALRRAASALAQNLSWSRRRTIAR